MGYPTIPSRAAFGPTKKNYLGRVGDPTYFENADEANAIRRQITGLGFVGDLAKVVFTTAATTPGLVLERHKYTWDQDPTSPATAPVLTRTGVGTYTIDLPAFGDDEQGNSVPIEVLDAIAHAQGDGSIIAHAEVTSATQITVTTKTSAGALSDTATTVVVRAGR